MHNGLQRFNGPIQPGDFPWWQRIHGYGALADRLPACGATLGFTYTTATAQYLCTLVNGVPTWVSVSIPSSGTAGGDLTGTYPNPTIASNAVTTAKILNAAVTLAKLANAAANSVLLGSGAAGAGSSYAEIALGFGLLMSGTTLSATMGGVIILQEQQTSGTNGGTFTSGTKQTRVLNTKPTDTGSDCSLSSNLFTLSAGTYEIEASAPGYFCGSHKTFLQNTTAGTTILTGTSEYSSNANTDGVVTRSLIVGRFAVAAGQALAIQHQCQATKATNGFGQACSFGTEIYTTVQLRRVA